MKSDKLLYMDVIRRDARIIWDYMHLNHELIPADILFVLGSRDDRVASYAAELYARNFAPLILVSGGKSLKNDNAREWNESSEAEHFAVIMEKAGIPPSVIFEERRATNTGENIRLSNELLKKKNLSIKSMIVVHKPYMERRTFATLMKQWPEKNTKIYITSPPISFEAYFNDEQPFDRIVSIMLGDLERIKEYPKLGFQIPQTIPANVEAAFRNLVKQGYNKHSL